MMLLTLKKQTEELISDHKLENELFILCEENGIQYDLFFSVDNPIDDLVEVTLENAIVKKY